MKLNIDTHKQPFDGPHQITEVVSRGVDAGEADAAMIMIHGRGATASSILDLANEVDTDLQLTLRAPQASSNTWYPYSFLEDPSRNEPGISSGLQKIKDIVENLEEEGIPKEKIYILGFSQGACLASTFVARYPARYGGLIALSGGLIGNHIDEDSYSGDLEGTPVFMGCSDVDAHIPKERVHESEAIFKKLGASVTVKLYPGMGHLVNQDEIQHIQQLLKS